jgi:hypothetical protein
MVNNYAQNVINVNQIVAMQRFVAQHFVAMQRKRHR